jgi:uncharacterized OsmC-like protein
VHLKSSGARKSLVYRSAIARSTTALAVEDSESTASEENIVNTQTIEETEQLNGVNVTALLGAMDACRNNAAAAQTKFAVTTDWLGGTKSRTRVEGCSVGGHWIDRKFEFVSDEPSELCGTNTVPNPQEYLMGALNACMTVGYVAGASLMGIKLLSVQIETDGDIDLRGFFGLTKTVPAGYNELRYTVRIKGEGTAEQMHKLHDLVIATSPNRYNLANAIPLRAKLVIE